MPEARSATASLRASTYGVADWPGGRAGGTGFNAWITRAVSIRPGVQRNPPKHGLRIDQRQLTDNHAGGRANADDRRVRDGHLITMRRVDLDPDIVPGIAARRDPDRHRQPGRVRVKVRHLEQVFGFRLDIFPGNCGLFGDVFTLHLRLRWFLASAMGPKGAYRRET
jgi:hypothetical protein